MALIKEKQLNDLGITANYWRIGMVSIDRVNGIGSFSINLYVNRAAKKPLEDKGYIIEKEIYPQIFENMIENVYRTAYEHIKTTDEYFKDAISDNEEVIKWKD